MSRRGITLAQAAALGIVVPGKPMLKRPTRAQVAKMTPPASFSFCVGGEPVPQPRQDGRVIYPGGKATVHMYTPKVREKIGTLPNGNPQYGPDQLEPWRDAVKRAARPHIRATWWGPVVVNIQFYFSRPKYLLTPKSPPQALPHTGQGDRDNLDKAVLDALSEMEPTPPWGNDLLVYAGEISKWYVALGKKPGARIEIVFQSITPGTEQLLLEPDPATDAAADVD